MKKESSVWAVKIGEPNWKIDLIHEQKGIIPDDLMSKIVEWCKTNGFDRIETKIIDLDNLEAPNFSNKKLINL
jgi:hypothetical protein